MKRMMYLLMLMFVTSTSLISLNSCRDTKSTGEKMEDAVDDTGDAIEDAADDVEDEVEDATDDN